MPAGHAIPELMGLPNRADRLMRLQPGALSDESEVDKIAMQNA
jgi:hypothetical protein